MGHERYGNQIQIAFNHTLHAEFRYSIFALLMLYHLLADALETCVLGQNRDIAVHLTIDLYGLYHSAAIRLQSAIKIMEFDTRNDAFSHVEELAW